MVTLRSFLSLFLCITSLWGFCTLEAGEKRSWDEMYVEAKENDLFNKEEFVLTQEQKDYIRTEKEHCLEKRLKRIKLRSRSIVPSPAPIKTHNKVKVSLTSEGTDKTVFYLGVDNGLAEENKKAVTLYDGKGNEKDEWILSSLITPLPEEGESLQQFRRHPERSTYLFPLLKRELQNKYVAFKVINAVSKEKIITYGTIRAIVCQSGTNQLYAEIHSGYFEAPRVLIPLSQVVAVLH